MPHEVEQRDVFRSCTSSVRKI